MAVFKKLVENVLLEGSFNRILSHLENSEACIISASRSENSAAQNAELTNELAKDIQLLRYGYVKVIGGYIENKGTPAEEEVTEKSFIVINTNQKDYPDLDFKADMLGLCNKYGQESIFLKSTGKMPAYYNKEGVMQGKPFGKFTIDNVKSYFTKAHNHAVEFIELEENTNIVRKGQNVSSRIASDLHKRKFNPKNT